MAERREDDPLAAASRAQAQAADPRRNAFVSANAGSGKTKVLVDRVIALLLAGAEPDRIVCLTYTKAAASEMRARLFQRLGGWAVAQDEALARDLARQGFGGPGAPDTPDTLARARSLFARALETPGGLKIQTIHAFCERVLRRFPLEAGLDPGFEVMDEAEARSLAAQAMAQGARGAASGANPALADAHERLAATVSEQAVDGLVRWIQNRASALDRFFQEAGGLAPANAALHDQLGVRPGEDAASIKAAAWRATDHVRLDAAAHALQAGGANDQKRAGKLQAALSAGDEQSAFTAYLAALFTKDGEGERVKSLITKTTAAEAPGVGPFLESEAVRLDEARAHARAADTAAQSAAGLAIAHGFVTAYARLKRRQGKADFTDLIARTAALVSRSDAAQWVLYKLDGGVDHVLVDEAQDTAPDQWALIDALTAEFTAGETARALETPSALARTVFAVGDEKQSIYSFQGAAPERFLEAGQRVSLQEPARFTAPALQVSFRSAPAVLEAVDAVFNDAAVADLLTPKGDIPRHQAARDDVRGCVELWPLAQKPDQADDPDPWAPVDAPAPDDPDDILARTLALRIAEQLARGEAVSERGPDGRWAQRAMRAGDVMILLRRRGGLFARIIQRLKGAGVPVAGADRLVLAQHAGVQDALGAARAALLPQDDLALAEWLKSPLLHPIAEARPPIDDDALFALAHGRVGRLCEALEASDDPRLVEAVALLADLQTRARDKTPYAFFAGLLDRASPTGESYAERIAHRLGPEAQDPLKELLNLALAHEGRPAPSLERFVRETLFDEADIKREDARARDEVRVMTVHGAKGLEAPVVILPDAADSAADRQARIDDGLFPHDAAGLVWSPRKPADPPLSAELRAARAQAAVAEDLRLLYVAMTRAQDRLIVCGAEGRGRGKPESWWGRVQAGLERAGAHTLDTPLGEDGLLWGARPAALDTKTVDAAAPQMTDIPNWALTPAPAPRDARARIAPSSLVANDPHPVFSPLSDRGRDDGGRRFRRGRWLHRLLEVLPEIRPEARDEAGRRVLTAEGVAETDQPALIAEVLAILDDPQFAPVFGPGSRAEVPVIGEAPGLPAGAVLDGRIDRLAVTEDEVLIVDFKTDRPPPASAADVGGAYLAQLGAYRAVMAAAYPDKSVRCALLWTHTGTLMAIADALLDEAPRLG